MKSLDIALCWSFQIFPLLQRLKKKLQALLYLCWMRITHELKFHMPKGSSLEYYLQILFLSPF